MFFTRFTALGICLVSAVVFGVYLPAAWTLPLFAVSAFLSVIGLYDLAQPKHSVRRNYPIIGRMRWFFEEIRPEIRQYLIEGDNDKAPFSRAQRSLVYARSKNESSDRAFGTLAPARGAHLRHDACANLAAAQLLGAPSARPKKPRRARQLSSTGLPAHSLPPSADSQRSGPRFQSSLQFARLRVQSARHRR